MKRVTSIILIVVLTLGLGVSFLTTDFEGGKYSEAENRTLAAFPDLIGEDAIEYTEAPSALEDWCSDNIGFKETFGKIYRRFSNDFLGIFPSDTVHSGKNDWYYIVNRNNIEIGTGDYLLSDDELTEISEYQQIISDYYNSVGKEYYLVLLPAKSSVYPEYLSGGNFCVTYTVVDQIEEYLKQHTDVKVINVKQALVEGKASAQMYRKNDSHWTSEGAYVGYQTIIDRLLKDGVIDSTVDLNPEFIYGENPTYGDISTLAGEGLVEDEFVSQAFFNAKAVKDVDSPKSILIDNILDVIEKAKTHEISRYEIRYINNKSPNSQKILIYGDSMLMEERQFTSFMAENFADVQYARVRSVSRNLDTAVDPDIVIFEAYERLTNHVLRYTPEYYSIDNLLPELEETSAQTGDQWIGTNGLCLEKKSTDYAVKDNKIVLSDSSDQFVFTGWAIDYVNKSNLDGLYVKLNDKFYYCGYGKSSQDLNKHFGVDYYSNSRFAFTLSRQFIEENNINELSFIMLSSDKKHYYPVITYPIVNEK